MKFICFFLVIFGTVNSRGNNNCPLGEVSVSCKSPCQPSCDIPTPALTPDCKACKVGCVCQLNLLRSTGSGRCIPPTQCPRNTICEDENMELTSCGSKCPGTCQSPCRNNITCIQSCVNRCQCKAGFLWDETLLKCIESSRCSICKCPDNEIWIQCNPQCEKTCNSIKNSQKCVPVNTCTPGCVCPKGFIRNEKTGKCIPINKCTM